MNLKEEEFPVWLGAYTDGEGYLDYHGTARVALTTTHRPTLDMIQERVGGTIRTLVWVRRQRKTRYQLCLTGPGARDYIRMVLPFLMEKKPQADLVLSLSPTGPRRRLTLEEHAHRVDVRRRLKVLRHTTS